VIAGLARFLKRVWNLCQSKKENIKNKNDHQDLPKGDKTKINGDLERITHKTIKKVTEDIEGLQYNTAISALMEFLNEITKVKSIVNCQLSIVALLKLLAPFAPYITEELWHEELGGKTSIHNEPWPEFDPEKIKEAKVVMVIQINGKVRSQIEIAQNASEAEIKSLALADEKIKKWLEGKEPKKVIIVPGRVVNIVI
jgi:leucyl-tRNA synthetase